MSDVADPTTRTRRIAQSAAPVRIERAPVTVELASEPTPVATRSAPNRVLLHLEDVRCAGRAGSYDVYLDLPPGAEPDPAHFGGRISLFGPRARADEAAQGTSVVLDVSKAGRGLAARPGGLGDPLRVTLVPVYAWSDPLTVGKMSLNVD